MENTITHYYLYCTNLQCQVSIYHNMVELSIPFTAENLVATHTCACCKKPLVSAMDIEIKQLMALVNSPKVNKTSFFNN